jgi:hypothetical protein
LSDNAIFEGTVSGFRTIGGRKVVAITIEAPIEHQVAIAKIAENGAWVAVARLQNPPQQPEKQKRSWDELPPAQQAAMRCQEPSFWQYMKERNPSFKIAENADEAAKQVRMFFGIDSRSELSANPACAAKWREIDSEYQHWLRT